MLQKTENHSELAVECSSKDSDLCERYTLYTIQ